MNAAGFPLLSLLTFLPLAGAVFILTLKGEDKVVADNARWTALWTSLIVFALSLILWFRFDKTDPGFQFVERLDWLTDFGITYHMGVDGISVLFVLLSTLLTPICVLASWDAIQTRVREYMVAFLVLETMMVGMFAALDFIGGQKRDQERDRSTSAVPESSAGTETMCSDRGPRHAATPGFDILSRRMRRAGHTGRSRTSPQERPVEVPAAAALRWEYSPRSVNVSRSMRATPRTPARASSPAAAAGRSSAGVPHEVVVGASGRRRPTSSRMGPGTSYDEPAIDGPTTARRRRTERRSRSRSCAVRASSSAVRRSRSTREASRYSRSSGVAAIPDPARHASA